MEAKKAMFRYIFVLSLVNALFLIPAAIWYSWAYYVPLAVNVAALCYSGYQIWHISVEERIEDKAQWRASQLADERDKKKG